MSVEYFYVGPFTNTINPLDNTAGLPNLASYNPYNSDTTIGLLDNAAAVATALTANYGGDNTDRSGSVPLVNAPTMPSQPTNPSAAFYIMGGGTSSYLDALGIVISTNVEPVLADLNKRMILLPNIHATSAPLQVVQGLTLPIPATDAPDTIPLDPISPTDAKGTKILELISTPFFNAGLTDLNIYPFILQNAWKYDIVSSSWYVDTNAPIYWLLPIVNADSTFHVITQDPSPAIVIPLLTADLADPPPNITEAWGWEDLNRLIANPDFTNEDFNDAVFFIETLKHITL